MGGLTLDHQRGHRRAEAVARHVTSEVHDVGAGLTGEVTGQRQLGDQRAVADLAGAVDIRHVADDQMVADRRDLETFVAQPPQVGVTTYQWQ